MQPSNMLRNRAIEFIVGTIQDNKHQIETRENRVGQSNIFKWLLFIKVLLVEGLLRIHPLKFKAT
jgi:hypothetical protein